MKSWLKLFKTKNIDNLNDTNINVKSMKNKKDSKEHGAEANKITAEQKELEKEINKEKPSRRSFVIELVFSILLIAAVCALRTVHLFANNVGLVTFADLGKSMWIFMGTSIAVFVVLRIFIRKPYFAGVFAAFGTFFAVNFNLLVDLLRLFIAKYRNAAIGGIILYAVLIVGFFFILRVLYKKNIKLNAITKILSVTFACLVVFNVVMAAATMGKNDEGIEVASADPTPTPAAQTTPEPVVSTPEPTIKPTTEITAEPTPEPFGQPNIYFFILDEYSSFDMMSKYYGYNNLGFENFLVTNDFNISRETYSTDNQTGHSIADLLNLEYISRRLSSSQCLKKIYDSPFFTTVSDLGYSQFQMSSTNKYFRGIVSLNSDEGTEAYGDIVNMFGDEEADDIVSDSSISDAFSELFGGEDIDDVLYEDLDGINEWGFYPSDVIRETDRFKDHKYEKYIDKILSVFDYYEDPSNYTPTMPKVTYTYMTAAHVPFIFNEYGTVLPYSKSRDWEDTDVYLGQYIFISKHMMASISTIIENDPDSIIIVMSDHGIRYHADCNRKHTFYITDKDSCRIMNAVYIKGEQYDIEGLSAINTLRFVLSLYEGQDFPPIEDPITSDSPDSLKGIIPKPR